MTNYVDDITFDRTGFYLQVKAQDEYSYYRLGKQYQIDDQVQPVSFEQLPQGLRWMESWGRGRVPPAGRIYFTVVVENRNINEQNDKTKPGQIETFRKYVGNPSEIEHQDVLLSAEDIANMSRDMVLELEDGAIFIL